MSRQHGSARWSIPPVWAAAVMAGAYLFATSLHVLQQLWHRVFGIYPEEKKMILLSTTAGTNTMAKDPLQSLLQWLSRHGGGPSNAPICLQVNGEGVRGVFATQDLPPHQVLLSVPETLFITEPSSEETPGDLPTFMWMALELLQKRRRMDWAPYFATLPLSCLNPCYQSSEAALQSTEDPLLIHMALRNRAVAEGCFEDLEGCLEEELPYEDFLWALAVLASRSVEEPQADSDRRVLPPGLDLVNHSFDPNCVLHFSTATPPALQLVTCQAVKKGQELTICYGNLPSRVFFLSYGFIPATNPFDTAVIFTDVEDLAAGCQAELQQWGIHKPLEELIEEISEVLPHDTSGFFMAANGVDDRLVTALQRVHPVEDFATSLLLHRCRHLLATSSTSVEEDRQILATGKLPTETALAVKYRMTQKTVLQSALDLLQCGNK